MRSELHSAYPRRSHGPRRVAAVLALALCVPLATSGCFGTFQLTRKAYKFNQEVDNDKFVQWGVFLAMNLVPIYPFATFLDAVFANSVEFWTGKNPVTASADGTTQTLVSEAGDVLRVATLRDGSIELKLAQHDGSERFVRLTQEGRYAVARDADGQLLARATDVGGKPVLIPAAR